MKELLQAAIQLADDHQDLYGELPFIIGYEIYEYFGKWVKIVEVEGWTSHANGGWCRVCIEDRFGERTVVDSTELTLREIT